MIASRLGVAMLLLLGAAGTAQSQARATAPDTGSSWLSTPSVIW